MRGALLTVVVVVSCVCMSACTGGSGGGAVHRAADVVQIRTVPYPEGPAGEVSRQDAAALFAALPDPLPVPLKQPTDCRTGNVTSLVLSDGETIDYGPCVRPAEIDALRCYIAKQPVVCR